MTKKSIKTNHAVVSEEIETELKAGELDSLEALDGMTDADFDDEIVVTDDTDVTDTDEALLDAVAGAEKDEAKAEAYEDQDDGEVAEVAATDKPSDKEVVKAKKSYKATVSGAKKSEVIRERLGEKLGDTLVLEMSDAELKPKALAKMQDEVLETIDNMAKKVGEKAVNLLGAVNGTSKLSAYTEIAFKFMKNNPEGFTALDLIAHMQDQDANGIKAYSLGTARSQSHQMVQLFSSLKLVNLDGKSLVMNTDSMLAVAIEGMLA